VGRPTLGFRRLWKEAAERADPEKVARMRAHVDAQLAVLPTGRGGLPPSSPLDPAKWREHARDLDEPLHFVEIADPDDAN
jgi:hypothetical protein